MTTEVQETVLVKSEDLVAEVAKLAKENYRLVQIGCTKLDVFEINYTFDKDYKFLNLRVHIPMEGAALPSISGVYFCAFTYENEIHDLFGIQINGLALDYGGKFYRINTEAPFKNIGAKPAPTVPAEQPAKSSSSR